MSQAYARLYNISPPIADSYWHARFGDADYEREIASWLGMQPVLPLISKRSVQREEAIELVKAAGYPHVVVMPSDLFRPLMFRLFEERDTPLNPWVGLGVKTEGNTVWCFSDPKDAVLVTLMADRLSGT